MIWLRLTVALAALGLSACTAVSSVTDLVVGEEDNSIPPAELIKFDPTIDVEEIWSDRFGKGVDNLFIQLIPAPYKTAVYTADRDGRMIALSAQTGEELWTERSKKLRISGGPGVGDGLVFAGTSSRHRARQAAPSS